MEKKTKVKNCRVGQWTKKSTIGVTEEHMMIINAITQIILLIQKNENRTKIIKRRIMLNM